MSNVSIDGEELTRDVIIKIQQRMTDLGISVYRYLIRSLPRFNVHHRYSSINSTIILKKKREKKHILFCTIFTFI